MPGLDKHFYSLSCLHWTVHKPCLYKSLCNYYHFVVDIWFFGIRQALQIIAVSVVFLNKFFSPGDGHVVMPDLTDFFDRKVSKVSLIFAVIITSVLSAVVIFHCLSYNFTGRCCYELQGSFSTFIAILWRLVSWSEKRQHCFLYFVVDIWFFGIQQALQIIVVTVVFLNVCFKRTLVMLSCPIWLIFLIENCQKSADFCHYNNKCI